MTRSTGGGRVSRALWRAGLLMAAALAGAGASGLSAMGEVDVDGVWGALPMKDPQTGTVVGHYCTGVYCYARDSAPKYSYCCVL